MKDNNDQPIDLPTPIRRGFLDHKLKGAVVKFDEKGKPITAGDLGMTKRETLDAMKKAGYKKRDKRLKVKRIAPLPVKTGEIKKAKPGYNWNGETTPMSLAESRSEVKPNDPT